MKEKNICRDCQSFVWAVGIGQGVFCKEPKKKNKKGQFKKIKPENPACKFFIKKKGK